jgi:hypothetical protein
MASLRNALLVAVLAATAIAAIAGFYITGEPPARLLVDAGLAGALGVVVWLLLGPTVGRTQALSDALRALARGDRQQRVNPDDFAGLADVARAMNEVAASLTENEDPNLGPVKREPHPTFKKRPERPAIEKPPDDVEMSDHPELGPVRVMKKKEPSAPISIGEAMSEAIASRNAKKNGASTPTPQSSSSTSSTPSTSSTSSTASASSKETSTPPEPSSTKGGVELAASPGAPSNDTSIDSAPRSDVESKEPLAQVPSRAELEVLFTEFVAAKKSHDESVADLEFEAFAQTIQGECERLIVAHQCKGVRFEVTEQDGEVSLRPRLLR